MHALAPLLEHDGFTVGPEALVGIAKLDCTEPATIRTSTCWSEGRGAFLFRASGRHPNHPSSLVSSDILLEAHAGFGALW